jgi:hypothetical protein
MSVASQDDSGSSRVSRPLLRGSVRDLTVRKIKRVSATVANHLRELPRDVAFGFVSPGNVALSGLAPEDFSARNSPKNADDSPDDFHFFGTP